MVAEGFAVIDFETTGLFPGGQDRVIEVAVVHTDLRGSVVNAMVSASGNFAGMTAEALDDDAKLAKLVELIGRALYAADVCSASRS